MQPCQNTEKPISMSVKVIQIVTGTFGMVSETIRKRNKS